MSADTGIASPASIGDNDIRSPAGGSSRGSISHSKLSAACSESSGEGSREVCELSPSNEALRLFSLRGITRTKVAEVLGARRSPITTEVGKAYMELFDFAELSVVDALRFLLERCSIVGETQAQERIVQFFAGRYQECNNTVGDADAVHSLTAAIMLLNQDLHGQNLGKKMSTSQFLTNVALLRDGKPPIPKSLVKEAYAQIKSRPLVFTLEEPVSSEEDTGRRSSLHTIGSVVLPNSVVEVNLDDYPTVLREGLMKSKKVAGSFGHRHWSLRYCIVRGFIMHIFKAESRRPKTVPDFGNLHNAVVLTHAIATPAVRYNKRLHCMQVVDNDNTLHLFQASSYDDLMSWVIAINRAAAIYSSKPLACPVGSNPDRFDRPPMPKHPSKANPEEQLAYYRESVEDLIKSLDNMHDHKPNDSSKNKRLYKVWEARNDYMREELVRYQSYVEAMTLNHEFVPTAKHSAELVSPSQSVSSLSSSTSSMSARSGRNRFNRTKPQSKLAESPSLHAPMRSLSPPVDSSRAYDSITPPPGSGEFSSGTRNSYREAVAHQ